MTLHELLLAEQVETIRRRNETMFAVDPQLPVSGDGRNTGGVRYRLASALVRLGLLLDRHAVESTIPGSQQEVRHAL